MSRKVLIFTYYWPPAGGVAVQRFLKFSKYLPEFGWEPIIVTVKDGSYAHHDESLLKEVSPSTRVYHTDTFEPFELYNFLRGKGGKTVPLAVAMSNKEKSAFQKFTDYIRANFFIPDAREGWVPYAVKKGEEIIKAEKIDAIITTGPPHSTHLIGLKLKKKFGTKWVADFRDPWTTIMYNSFLPRTASTIARDKALEQSVLKGADANVLISRSMAEDFSIPVASPITIYNGFDEEDFKGQPEETQGHFTLRYVGNFLPKEDCPGLYRALKRLLDKNPDFQKYFRFEITGRVDASIIEKLTAHGLDPWIHYHDFVPHQNSIRLMQGANVLLLLFSNVEGNKSHMTGKLFEYIATKNPILGFGHTSGEATAFLQEIGCDPLLNYEDDSAAELFIAKYFSLWLKDKKRYQYTNDKYILFSRRNLAKQLAYVLNNITL